MTKRIFRSIALVAGVVLIASVVLIMSVLYTHFSTVQFEQMRAQAVLVVQGIEKSGADYLEALDPEGYRLTWIDADGTVLYDNTTEAGSMENHLQRDEVQQAIQNGEGESSRYSDTLLERHLYVAKKVADGSIVRISDAQRSIPGLLLGMLRPILLIVIIAFSLSLLLAYRLSKRIIKPLSEINLDRPEQAAVYKELTPMVEHIKEQQDRIRAQNRELWQKQQEFDATTANMKEGLLILNADREVISCNRAAARILGIRQYKMGELFSELSSIPDIEAAYEQILSGQETERTVEFSGKPYNLHFSPVFTDDQVRAVVIFILDVSQRQRIEQMRREFTANVSHELKTPLQTISGSAELIAAGLVKAEDVSGFGHKIYDEAQRLITLIEDIIGLSKLDEGMDVAQFEEVDLFAVSERTIAELSPVAADSDITLDFSGESAMVMGDPTMLGSIVYNLCENAIKYSRPQETVQVRVSSLDGAVKLEVKDQGIGIPQEEQERIFERFYRVDKARSKEVGGTGLGLSIVKHAVEIHKGQIRLESEPGAGTTITVIFPQAS